MPPQRSCHRRQPPHEHASNKGLRHSDKTGIQGSRYSDRAGMFTTIKGRYFQKEIAFPLFQTQQTTVKTKKKQNRNWQTLFIPRFYKPGFNKHMSFFQLTSSQLLHSKSLQKSLVPTFIILSKQRMTAQQSSELPLCPFYTKLIWLTTQVSFSPYI